MNAESATWRPEEQTLAVSRFRRTNCSLILNKTCKYISRKKNETYKINKRHYVCLALQLSMNLLIIFSIDRLVVCFPTWQTTQRSSVYRHKDGKKQKIFTFNLDFFSLKKRWIWIFGDEFNTCIHIKTSSWQSELQRSVDRQDIDRQLFFDNRWIARLIVLLNLLFIFVWNV